MFRLIGARGAGASLVQVGGAAAAFGLNVLLARSLGVAEYGLFAFAFSSVGLVVMFCKLGTDRLLMRELSIDPPADGPDERKQEFVATTLVVTIAALVVTALVIVILTSGALDRKREVLLYATALVLPMSLVYTTQGALRGLGRIVTAMMPRFIVFPTGVGVVVIIAIWYGSELRAANVLTIAAVCMTAALFLSLFWVRRDLKGLRTGRWSSASDLKSVVVNSAPFLLVTTAGAAMSSIDIIMVGALSSASAVGVYSAGAKCATLLAMALTAGNLMMGPYVARLYYGGDHDRLQVLLSGTVLLVTAAVTAGVGFYAVGGRFILELFGSAFEDGYTVLILLALGQLVNAMCGPTALVCSMVGLEWFATRVLVFTVVGFAVSLLWVVPMYGAIGAAVLNIIANVVWNVSMVAGVWRKRQLGLSVFHGLRTIWVKLRTRNQE